MMKLDYSMRKLSPTELADIKDGINEAVKNSRFHKLSLLRNTPQIDVYLRNAPLFQRRASKQEKEKPLAQLIHKLDIKRHKENNKKWLNKLSALVDKQVETLKLPIIINQKESPTISPKKKEHKQKKPKFASLLDIETGNTFSHPGADRESTIVPIAIRALPGASEQKKDQKFPKAASVERKVKNLIKIKRGVTKKPLILENTEDILKVNKARIKLKELPLPLLTPKPQSEMRCLFKAAEKIKVVESEKDEADMKFNYGNKFA